MKHFNYSAYLRDLSLPLLNSVRRDTPLFLRGMGRQTQFRGSWCIDRSLTSSMVSFSVPCCMKAKANNGLYWLQRLTFFHSGFFFLPNQKMENTYQIKIRPSLLLHLSIRWGGSSGEKLGICSEGNPKAEINLTFVHSQLTFHSQKSWPSFFTITMPSRLFMMANAVYTDNTEQ